MVTVDGDIGSTDPRSEQRWRYLVAIGCVADDLSATAIARYARTHLSEAEAALSEARVAGVIDDHGLIDEFTRLELVADLPTVVVAEVHAAVARRLFAEGPDRIVQALAHARAAGTRIGLDEMVAMADLGGRMSLSVSDYSSARRLLELAVELDTSGDHVAQGNRLCDLAAAFDGLGDVNTARQHLFRAVNLAEVAGNATLAARAAVQHALPADWYTGNQVASSLLQRAAGLGPSDEDHVRINAALAFTENRIPLEDANGQQLAWVTRVTIAQGFADAAVNSTTHTTVDTKALGLLAWRTTHRGPSHLARRREISTEALDLAQLLRNPSHQVEAAVMLAVDAIESGDRPLFDHALAVARWVALRDGNPRLLWRAHTLTAGAAHLDGDIEGAQRHRALAREAGKPIGTPGWLGAELLLIGEELIGADDPDSMRPYLLDESYPALANPIGRAGVAYLFARTGDIETAERYARRSFRQLDHEASYLLLATRIADVALAARADALARDLVAVLTPWASHVSVDSHGWWCDGPVAVWLALLHHHLGDDAEAHHHLEIGEPIAQAINDVRSLRRAATLRAALSGRKSPPIVDCSLTPRELEVLALLAHGYTNPEIALALAYSVSTIRMDTISIYRKLDVKGRPEAVARAAELGWLRSDPSAPES